MTSVQAQGGGGSGGPDSTSPGQLPVVLLWHMHQPEYRVDGQYRLPWVHLHAIGAYSDMAAHLEAEPAARAVVNFSPVLLDQLADMGVRLRRLVDEGRPAQEPLLDALVAPPPPGPERAALVQRCRPEHDNPRVRRLPAYPALAEALGATSELDSRAASALRDLLILFHLSWLGESVRRADPRARVLWERARAGEYGGRFDADDARSLLALVADTVASLLSRYRALADAGRVELSMTPYYHPLMPLLVDFGSARDAAPGVALPGGAYPGGVDRVRWHLDEGLRRFRDAFGRRPAGCWPSEAAVSEATLGLVAERGFAWLASSERVLQNTLLHAGVPEADPFRAYSSSGWRQGERASPGEKTPGTADPITCFFRHDGLSDRIGFRYKDRSAEEAVRDFVGELERIAAQPGREVALIALDGENPWEWYPDNGYAFLSRLYGAFVDHPRLRLATLSESCAAAAGRAGAMPPLQAGSWVNGQLLTWIGHAEKNRLWSLLVDAKERVDEAGRETAVRSAASAPLEHLLGACEGSDWFWWPGKENPPASVADFDALFRAHLAALYTALGETPPTALSHPLATGTAGPVAAGGTMKASGTAVAAAPLTDEVGSEPGVKTTEIPEQPWAPRRAGVLLHLTSLPSGRLDADAFRFIDLAAEAGLAVWQLLPVGPRDEHGNPFQPASAFAGDAGLLPPENAKADKTEQPSAYRAFRAANDDWLIDWALFVALKAENDGACWWEWPVELRHRAPVALDAARRRLADAVERECRRQFAFDVAWAKLKEHAEARKIVLFGDVPLFVAHDSADVWAHRELFEVNDDGTLGATVGVPPDEFSETGQMWGYPPYRWEELADEGFSWWKRRFEVQARRFHLLRLDHFRGFAAWWRLPAGAAEASQGRWISGPGAAAIDCLRPVLGETRLVAEDLGVITPDVTVLRKQLKIPGMRVLQFAFDGDPENLHLPQHHTPDSVCYTGTHDNDTTLGWWKAAGEAERSEVGRLFGEPDGYESAVREMPQALVDCAWASRAPLAVVPLQDLLGLGSEARMNTPGVAAGNWAWRFRWSQIAADFAPRLRAELARHGRLA